MIGTSGQDQIVMLVIEQQDFDGFLAGFRSAVTHSVWCSSGVLTKYYVLFTLCLA